MMVVVGWMGAWESDLSMEQEQMQIRENFRLPCNGLHSLLFL